MCVDEHGVCKCVWVGRAGINRAVPGGSRCVSVCRSRKSGQKRCVCVCVENVLQMLQDNTNLIWAVNHNQRVYRGREREKQRGYLGQQVSTSAVEEV